LITVLDWLRGTRKRNEPPLQAWREAWAAAVQGSSEAGIEELERQIETAAAAGTDVEVEEEMLEALVALRRLQHDVRAGTLPLVETQHRVVSGERCHFSAPVSQPGDPGASGRVLFTASRLIFVGSARTASVPWHRVGETARLERDLLLARSDGGEAVHLRFNTFGDAVAAAFLAQELKARLKPRL
jgi:hypothetical protein